MTALRGLSAMGEVEMRMGLDPIENVLDDASAIVEKLATLRAKYGAGGTYQDLRKIELARLAALTRAQLLRAGIAKPTEAMIDEMAHAHPDYVAFVTLATQERAEWVRLEHRLKALEFVANRGQMVGKFVTTELALQR